MNRRKLIQIGILLTLALWFAVSCLSSEQVWAQPSIRLSRKAIVMIKGKKYTLSTSVEGTDEKIIWSSSDKTKAAVNKKGKITAKKKGTVWITASAAAASAKCRVRIVNASLSQTSLALKTGESAVLGVNNTKKKITWSSNNTAVAEVSAEGTVTAKSAGAAVITAQVGVNKLKCKVTVGDDIWQSLLNQYQKDAKVNQLIFVKYEGGSDAELLVYKKKSGTWELYLECTAYVGQNGIGKEIQGDRKTPTGVFDLTGAFGIKDNPGALMSYVKVNNNLYWCADPLYYNQLVDVSKKPHNCEGEHLIDYVPQYYYGMFLGYNPENVVGKGAAIFLHCMGSRSYTMGCIAISQENMIKVLQNVGDGAKICIYPAAGS